MVLDGGLATELEAQGCDLNDPLWSAKTLFESPEAIRAAHTAFLAAGADAIATATYQASFEGFRERGIDDAEIPGLLTFAIDLACEARDAFWDEDAHRAGRVKPSVVASVGPYGAILADGSEYRGDYGLSAAELYDFHAPRWEVFAESRADLIGCETTPAMEEALAYARLAAVSGCPTWVSFQCRDAASIADGTPIEELAAVCDEEPNIVAIGINCTDPVHVNELVRRLSGQTPKPILVYPNSGETWDAEEKVWVGSPTPTDWAARARSWSQSGAHGIGGCCRVTPNDIRAIRDGLSAT